jgi:hypothetical protein
MPFVIIALGAILLAAAYQGRQSELFALMKGEFTGSPNYLTWMFVIFAIGAVGYIPALKPVSTSFLVLVIIVLFLSNGGFFQQFFNAANPQFSANPAGNFFNTFPNSLNKG